MEDHDEEIDEAAIDELPEFKLRVLSGDVMDDDDLVADALRRQYYDFNDFFRGFFHEMRLRMTNTRTMVDCLRTFDVMALALGYMDVAGAESSAALARKYGKPKETVNKPLLEVIVKFKLPPLPGQRDKDGKSNIRKARNENRKLN